MESATVPEIPSGTRLGGGFRMLRLLGRGGTAEVHAAVDERTGRTIALKLARYAESEGILFQQYAAACRVEHPNIVAVHELVRLDDGRCGLVMDWVRGEQLSRCLPLHGPAALDVARGVTRAVAALHGCGLVHGDLSPDNVLVELQGERAVARLIDLNLTAPVGEVRGAPGYLAPEILRGSPPSAAADLYSLGCLLHELVVGTRVFAGVDPSRLIDHHLNFEPELPAHLDGELREVLAALLAKEPDHRPPSAEIVLALLARLAGEPPEQELTRLSQTLLARRELVGQSALRGHLERAIAAVQAGRGSTFVISGAPGSGRTALGAWLRGEASRAGAVPVLVAQAGPEGHGPRSSLDGLFDRFAPPDASPSPLDPIGELARVVAERADERPRVVVIDCPDEDPVGLRRTYECLIAASRLGPVLGVVLTGPSPPFGRPEERLTIAALDDTTRLMLVVSRVGAAPETTGELGHLLDQGQVETPAHGVRMLELLVERGLLFRMSGRWCLDRGGLTVQQGEIARAAADWAARDLDGLDGAERDVLAAAAVLRDAGDAAALALVSGRETDAVEMALISLLGADLLRSDDGLFYGMTRPPAAAAALARCGDAFRARAHRAAAELRYVDLPAFEQDARRTWHRLHAGDRVEAIDVARAAEWWTEHGQGARALALLEEASRRTVRGRGAVLFIARARALDALGDAAQARRVLEAASHDGDEAAIEELGALLVRIGEHAAALDVLRNRARSPRGRLELARARLSAGDHANADADARALWDERADEAVRAGAAHVRSTCAWHAGDLVSAERYAQDGLGLLEASNRGEQERSIRADLERALGAARIYRGDQEGARTVLERAVADNRLLGRSAELARCLNNLGMALYNSGDWVGAERCWDELRLLTARQGDPLELANATNNLGFLCLRLGESERAARLFRRALAMAEAGRHARIIPVARANLGEALAHGGDLVGAKAAYDQAWHELRELDAPHDLLELERRRAELLLLRGEPFAGRGVIETLAAHATLGEVPLEVAHVERVRAACLRESGSPKNALPLAREAVQRFLELGAAYEEALAREELGRVLLDLEKASEAQVEVDRAVEVWARLQAKRDLARAKRLQRDIALTERASDRHLLRGQVLLDVARQFGSTLTLDRLLPVVLDRVVGLLKAERGVFALCDPAGNIEQAVVHNLEWGGPGKPLPVSHGLIEQVLRTGEAVTVEDVMGDRDYRDRHSVLLHGLRSMVGVPVMDRGRPVGVIYVDSRLSADTNLADERDLLSALARLVATAVANARLFEEQRFRGQLLATMVHDFRSPLTVVHVNSMLLHNGDWDGRADVAAMAADVEAAAQQMLKMVDDTLELSRIDAGAAAPTPQYIDLADTILKHVKPLEAVGRPNGVSIRLRAAPGLPTAHTIPERLAMIITNLVFNALKFAPSDSAIEILVGLRDDPGPTSARNRRPDDSAVLFRRVAPLQPVNGARFLETTVINLGEPIPDVLREDLFRTYVSGRRQTGGIKSTGLGLSIVDQCARNLGGCVWVESDVVAGTRFSFTLPTEVRRQAPEPPRP